MLQGTLSGLRQFLAECSLKMMKNAYFRSKALFVLKILKLLSWICGHVPKRLDKINKVNFKFYDVTAWLTNKYTYCSIPREVEAKVLHSLFL